MSEAQEKILKMLADGAISVEEASALLDAFSEEDQTGSTTASLIEADDIQEAQSHQPPPELSRIKKLWWIPFIIAFGSAVISGAGLVLMYQSSQQVALFGLICIWSLFILALFVTLFFIASWRSRWLYLKVEEPDGSRYSFGLPVPLGWVNWLVKIARPFVPARHTAYLDTAMTFVTVMGKDPEAVPIVIDVDDDDGEKVQIYIG